MATERQIAEEAIARGIESVQGFNSSNTTLALTMAATGFDLETQNRIVALVGPIGPALAVGGSGGGGMTLKVVWSFRGPEGEVWQETYHKAGTSFYQAASPPTTLVNLRLAFLNKVYRLNYIRASDVSQPRAAYTNYINAGLGLVAGAGAVNTPALAADAVIVRVFSDDFRFITKQMRGWTQNQIIRDAAGNEQIPTNFAQVQAFFKSMAENGYGWAAVKPVDPVLGGQYAYNKITSVNGTTTPGSAIITCATAINPSPGNKVLISLADAKTLNGLNGIWATSSPVNNQFIIPYQVAGNLTITGGKVRMRVYDVSTFVPFSSLEPNAARWNGLDTRQTRDVFSRGRGSRSVRGLRILV